MAKSIISKSLYIGVDIGGTKIAVGLVDESGMILGYNKGQTPQDAKPQVIFSHLVTLIYGLLSCRQVDISRILGVGIGIPGIVSANHKDIVITPNTNLSRFPLAKKIEMELGLTAVLGNDVNLGLLGEQWLGAARGIENVIGLFPGTGVGGAIILNGRLWLGSQGAAAELGHMILDMHSDHSSAGVRGSVEALASRRAIERDIRAAVAKGRKTLVTGLLKGDLSLIKSRIISHALKKRDAVVVRAVHDACGALGKTCISLRHIFNPDMILFGGGVIEACGEYMLPKIRRVSQSDQLFQGVDQCRIVQSQLGDDAVILGAVALLKQMQGDKSYTQIIRSPFLAARNNTVLIDKRKTAMGFYIRADGRIKRVNIQSGFYESMRSHLIGKAALEKICKKRPHLLIIAGNNKRISVSLEGRKYLRENAILFKAMHLTEAVQLYNLTHMRKAILIP